jgi:Tfp pilus assembly protein FimV
MRNQDKTLIASVCVLAASCSSSTKEARTYWTKEAGVVVVHHVIGKTDTMEKLTQNQLSRDEVKAVGLPKGKYFKVVDAQGQVTPAATLNAPGNKLEVEKKDGLAELSKQLRTLKSQVKTVEAQNQRLQDEMNASERQKTAQELPVEGQVDGQPDVRLSQ